MRDARQNEKDRAFILSTVAEKLGVSVESVTDKTELENHAVSIAWKMSVHFEIDLIHIRSRMTAGDLIGQCIPRKKNQNTHAEDSLFAESAQGG